MSEINNQSSSNNDFNGVPPLNLQSQADNHDQAKEVKALPAKTKPRSRYPILIIGGLLLVGSVLGLGYKFLAKTGRIAENKEPNCASLVPQDCETVPGCKLESKNEPITKKCSVGNCDHPGCKKETIEVGGRCMCDPTSGASGRNLTTRQACEKYKDDGCFWIPKNDTVCSGTYTINYRNEYCVSDGSKKYTKAYCVKDPAYKPPTPKSGGGNSSGNGNGYCNGSSDAACYDARRKDPNSSPPYTFYKPGDDCMGGNGTCVKLKDSPDGTVVCGCHSKTCSGGVSHGCGVPPDNIPKYNKTAKIGPFEKDGELVLLFYPLNVDGGGGVLGANINYEGKDYYIKIGKGKQRIVTNIKVKAGTTATLTKVVEREQHDSCAPHEKPYQGIGWIPVNNDQTCGTGLPGPPQGGKCTPFAKPSVAQAIQWAKNFGDPILSKECWADWMEWPGDYDFEDYFIMFAYIPEGVSCQSLTKDVTNNIQVGDKITLTCKGVNASGEGKLNYEFRYSVDGGDYQNLTAKGNKTTLTVNKAGLYQVECRVCLAGTDTCSSQWLPAKVK